MNNATRTAAQTLAADILARVQKLHGRYSWERLSPDSQLVEVRALLCCDMLSRVEAPDHALMVEVHRELITTLLPVE